MKTLILLLALSSVASASEIDQMMAYANNAILDAATTGNRKVFLTFGKADPDSIEQVANDLRERGYKIDEQAFLLNPTKIHVLKNYSAAKMAKAAR